MAATTLRLVYVRNTPVWGFDRFKTDALVNLFADLERVIDAGMPPLAAQGVAKALTDAANQTSSASAGTLVKDFVSLQLEAIRSLFDEWLNLSGSDAADGRRHLLQKMRERRKKITKRLRGKGTRLASELEIQTIDAIYESFRSLAKRHPDIFIDLTRAVGRYFAARA